MLVEVAIVLLLGAGSEFFSGPVFDELSRLFAHEDEKPRISSK